MIEQSALSHSPVLLALVATTGTWFLTALGAGAVFLTREVNRKLLDSMLGFAAGVMTAASFWSLLAPGIETARHMGMNPWLTSVVGFLGGGAFMRLVDRLLPHLHGGMLATPEGTRTPWQRSTLLLLAITLHNIPEGLAVGVAFGAVGAGLSSASFGSAMALAIGIGLQNLPEGTAVSMPLRREGVSATKSFLLGQLSAVVEPVGGVLGALFVMRMRSVMPYALSFAAGAMIFVVVEELIPESQRDERHIDTVTMTTLLGFALMMALDVALG